MVRLAPMRAQEYAAWVEEAIANYARERVRAGNTPEDEALEMARKTFDHILPQGLETPSQHLYTIRNPDDEPVGVIWFGHGQPETGLPPTTGAIYDLVIYPAHRRRGYGRAAMLALEEEARRFGLTALALHVFGHNTAARALYEGIGYRITNINMRKDLG